MEKIKSITEAFSMQPATFDVDNKPSSLNPEDSIEKIELEVCSEFDAETYVYVGYNFDGKKKFMYLAKSVNVHYY